MNPLQCKIFSKITLNAFDIEAPRILRDFLLPHFNRMKETRSAIVRRKKKKVVRRIAKKTKKFLAYEYLLNVLRVASINLNQYTKLLKDQSITIQKMDLQLKIVGKECLTQYNPIRLWEATYFFNLQIGHRGEVNCFHKEFKDLRRLANFVIDFRETHIFDNYDSMFHLKSFKRTEGEMAYDDFFLEVSGDCCVCYDPTKSKTHCCQQHYCRECFNKANEKCPLCRRKFPFSNQLWYEHVEDAEE